MGEVVACPTEGVFGLSCDPRSPQALARLAQVKPPSGRAGYLVIGADLAQLDEWMAAWSAQQREKARRLWEEGGVNLVGPAPAWVAPQVAAGDPGGEGGRTVGLRLCRHPQAAQLCLQAGGCLVSTSANPPDDPPATTAAGVHAYFGEGIAGIVQGEIGDGQGPRPIYDLQAGRWLRR